ncbi:MAG TPA: pyridoxal phosphate-dependent aminotransferase [Candidatus Kapabacteria bacterium]|nr:pyridoxal phosphate-dependent aminotransferase [Candidatus Kapabacteria bacterium]
MRHRPSPDLERRLSQRSCCISESTTLAIAAEAKRMQAAGVDVVSLSTGEPDFPTPESIKQAAIAAIDANFTYYTQSDGIPELRRAIATKFSDDNQIPTEPSEVLVSVGGKHSIFNALAAIIDDGDEVLIPAPYWVSYPEMVRLVSGVAVEIRTSADDRYKITPQLLEQYRTQKSRAIIINSPSNPTGVMYSREELEAIGRWAAESGLYVISDELYEKIVYDGNEHFSIGSMPELSELAITVNGVSKAYSMTGWRIGYMRAPIDVLKAASRVQSQVTSSPPSISQMAALAAIETAADEVLEMTAAFERRRDLICGLLEAIPGIRFPRPDGAFYVFVDVSEYFTESCPGSEALARVMLAEHHVATVPGSAFGDDRCIRLSYACSDENIREGVARFRRALEGLRR